MKRTATARWRGGLKDGKGAISTASGVLKETPYSFTTRFENGAGTNPEELIAAAHAGCFSMALSNKLGEAKLGPESIETTAELALEKLEKGWTITEVKLATRVQLANADEAAFKKAAEDAKANCPVSRLLNAKITLDAQLVKAHAA